MGVGSICQRRSAQFVDYHLKNILVFEGIQKQKAQLSLEPAMVEQDDLR